MKKQITAIIVIAALAGVFTTGCKNKKDNDNKVDETVVQKDDKVDETIAQEDSKVDETVVQKDDKVDETVAQKDDKADETVVQKDYKVGESIIFGHYEQDNDTTNGKEPITWRILDKKNSDEYLIISEKVLDAKPYNENLTEITWEKSTIRSWLNGYDASFNKFGRKNKGKDYTSENFIDTAFTAEEKAKIIDSKVPAHKNPEDSYPSPGNDTTDKVFLLSIKEAEKYFKSDKDRLADATRYAVEQGVLPPQIKCTDICLAEWWLRTLGFDTDRAAFVTRVGTDDDYGYTAGYANGDGIAVYHVDGVRPAMWIKW